MLLRNGFAGVLFVAAICGPMVRSLSVAQEIATPRGMQKTLIHDPVVNMDAYEVFIPLKWHFQGVIIQGTSCMQTPFPVFRASSPDGLTIFERMPRMDWQWGSSPLIAKSTGNCLPLTKPLTAQEFVKYLAAIMKVDYIGDDPVQPEVLAAARKQSADSNAQIAQKYRMNGMTPPTETIDMARGIVRFKNGSFTLKGLLIVTVDCTQSTVHANPNQPAWTTNTCFANTRYEHAPEAQYAAAMILLDPKATGAVEMQNWSQARVQISNQQARSNMNRIGGMARDSMEQTKASANEFAHSQAVRQHMNDQFIDTMKRGTQMSMNETGANMNARSTATSDWVDYSLDQQTVRDPNTGQITKADSSYDYTWIDKSHQNEYQTKDVNANPNGVYPGDWVKQTVTHGDGSSK